MEEILPTTVENWICADQIHRCPWGRAYWLTSLCWFHFKVEVSQLMIAHIFFQANFSIFQVLRQFHYDTIHNFKRRWKQEPSQKSTWEISLCHQFSSLLWRLIYYLHWCVLELQSKVIVSRDTLHWKVTWGGKTKERASILFNAVQLCDFCRKSQNQTYLTALLAYRNLTAATEIFQ